MSKLMRNFNYGCSKEDVRRGYGFPGPLDNLDVLDRIIMCLGRGYPVQITVPFFIENIQEEEFARSSLQDAWKACMIPYGISGVEVSKPLSFSRIGHHVFILEITHEETRGDQSGQSLDDHPI